ncbi:MAG: tRNA (N6-threonylcarbamoyladenosine(37)-N6)-methyltransferase TrmO, partial [Bacteroidales bacterium]|nr:tRNA (N6-threonylcarbamoyladenosine(37)-N6)-methyltransferase TrmO [Bacteroidales bacterium]
VILPAALSEKIGDESKISSLVEILQLDPRPSYHNDSDREYGLSFSGYNIRFRVDGNRVEVIGIS